jgi:hypothetical protein
MSIRFSRLAIVILVVAVMALMSSCCWAIFYGLGPSKDEWGVKYDVAVTQADKDNLNVVFTLADEGRLKPFWKLELISMSKPADNQGSLMYDMRSPFELKMTPDGLRAGQVQIRKEFADSAMIRILTLTVDGQRQTRGAAYYDIPLNKYLKKAPAAGSPLASPPASKSRN